MLHDSQPPQHRFVKVDCRKRVLNARSTSDIWAPLSSPTVDSIPGVTACCPVLGVWIRQSWPLQIYARLISMCSCQSNVSGSCKWGGGGQSRAGQGVFLPAAGHFGCVPTWWCVHCLCGEALRPLTEAHQCSKQGNNACMRRCQEVATMK